MKPVLTLSTIRIPRLVVIDGESHALRADDDLTLQQVRQVQRLSPAIAPIFEETVTDEQLAAMLPSLAALCAIRLDAPAAVLDKLTASQQLAIVIAANFGIEPAPTAEAAA
jgi:hypothetical protein